MRGDFLRQPSKQAYSINKSVETVFDFLTNLQNQKAWISSITYVVFSGKVAVVVFPGTENLVGPQLKVGLDTALDSIKKIIGG